PVGLFREHAVPHGVERAHELGAGEIFLRHHADAVALDLVGKLADARRFQRGQPGYGQQVSAAELKQKLALP
ncbi:MAG: hypothetical protein JO000_07140, partial [Alphaproteobacteria bacterium]|nr:hypothetical protein [Alphaproteobacteria bacterium]